MKHTIAIFDTEQIYAERLMRYLETRKALPFAVCTFSKQEELLAYAKKEEIELLLVAENCMYEEMEYTNIRHTMVLREGGDYDVKTYPSVYKYQSSDNIVRAIMDYYMEKDNGSQKYVCKRASTSFIGIYSPVGRCLKTSFSLVLGQLLAKSKKVLYLNFETYAGQLYLQVNEEKDDISDLLYFLQQNKQKFSYKINQITESMNQLDFIPPAGNMKEVMEIEKEVWEELLESIKLYTEYEIVILDLSDMVQGLFDILKKCSKIYTFTKEDGMAMAKIKQYEELLTNMEYRDIIEKTKKWSFPVFRDMPMTLENLPYSQLADFVKIMIKEDFDE